MSNVLLHQYSLYPEDLYNINTIVSDAKNATTAKNLSGLRQNPISQIYNLFQSGKWLNTYELPFFNDTYLESKSFKHWSTGNLESTVGDGGGNFAKYLKTRNKYRFSNVSNI